MVALLYGTYGDFCETMSVLNGLQHRVYSAPRVFITWPAMEKKKKKVLAFVLGKGFQSAC